MAYDFLTEVHPVWAAYHERWSRREMLLRGGEEVIENELVKFEWETDTGDSYTGRKAQAVYPGFGDAFLRTIVGHVLKDRPETDGGLSFGQMGKVERSDAQPSQAELVYYNVNGTGGDGQQFWQWVGDVFQRAGATGIRWVLTEVPSWAKGPNVRPTDQDVQNGQRPYAVEFSPVQVTNWKFARGQLHWCVIKIRTDTRRVTDGGKMEGAANEVGYYLLVRQGVTELGAEFAGGGWWKFTEKKEKVAENGTAPWTTTRGEIPMALAVWEWEAEPSGDVPIPLAKGATTSIDNLSVAYMNAKSAWRSNMWRAAGGPTFLLGVDQETWEIVKQQWEDGTSLLGIPAPREGTVSIAHSSAAAASAEAFKATLDDMTAEAERMMVQEATSAPESSGASKEAGFTESKAPRLTMLSENMASFINTLLRFFELRFGHANPSAEVKMPREFDLMPVEAEIRGFVETFRKTQLRSVTLETEAAMRIAEKAGLVNDENREKVRGELEESATTSIAAGTQEAGDLGNLFGGL